MHLPMEPVGVELSSDTVASYRRRCVKHIRVPVYVRVTVRVPHAINAARTYSTSTALVRGSEVSGTEVQRKTIRYCIPYELRLQSATRLVRYSRCGVSLEHAHGGLN